MSSSDEKMSSSGEKKASVVRLSLRELDEKCNAKKKNDFLKAWKLIKELPPTNPNSFWSIATYHGMPFKHRRVALGGNEGEEDSSSTAKDEDKDQEKTWGGYCQHNNVLFPFWHRFYCLRLEQALQSVLERGNERVALHYWDATSKESKSEGLPHIVTAEHVYIDGEYVRNPLLEFTLPLPIEDDVKTTDTYSQFYKKEAGYNTCRYPYSGIRHPEDAKVCALRHNDEIDGKPETAQSLLQANIIGYLNKGVKKDSVSEQFEHCLETTDYNPFSNKASVAIDCPDEYSLEQPHDDLHLAIGGFPEPITNPEDGSVLKDLQGNLCWDGPIPGANGDMGANEVASYDPVFFLHHCNIDRVFWIWQKKHGKTDPETFAIDTSDKTDKGISNSWQGATPNQTWGQTLNEHTILYPFQDEYGVPRTSKDCINIVSQLDYDYSEGSLDPTPVAPEDKRELDVLDSSTTWQAIRKKLGQYIDESKKRKRATYRSGVTAPRERFRIVFDRTHFTSTGNDLARQALPVDIPMDPPGSTVRTIEGVRLEFKNFVQVKDIDKDKISGSFLVQVFRKDKEKFYYLGQRGVLSRWNRSNCANCQGRKMAHISIPIEEDDIDHYKPENLEVHIVHKDGFTGKYKRERYAGKDLVAPVAARSAPGEQAPLLYITGVALLD